MAVENPEPSAVAGGWNSPRQKGQQGPKAEVWLEREAQRAAEEPQTLAQVETSVWGRGTASSFAQQVPGLWLVG